MTVPAPPSIYVIAGVNGAGKSSIAGAALREFGSDYYNPDEVARALRRGNPALSQGSADGEAWRQGVRLLKRAIRERLAFAFETTLAGKTIPRLLAQAASQGIAIRVWYVGLAGPELHLARVRARVRRGGHDVPEEHILRRYERSRANLIALLPVLSSLKVFDNSADADPAAGKTPKPWLVLHVEGVKIIGPADLSRTPSWAKPIVAAARLLVRT